MDEAEGHQLFESEVDALLAYVAIEEGPDLDPGQASRSDVEGLDDAPSGGIDGSGVEEEAGTGTAVVPHGQGGVKMASVDEGAAIECGVDGAKAQDLSFGAARGGTECILATVA